MPRADMVDIGGGGTEIIQNKNAYGGRQIGFISTSVDHETQPMKSFSLAVGDLVWGVPHGCFQPHAGVMPAYTLRAC